MAYHITYGMPTGSTVYWLSTAEFFSVNYHNHDNDNMEK